MSEQRKYGINQIQLPPSSPEALSLHCAPRRRLRDVLSVQPMKVRSSGYADSPVDAIIREAYLIRGREGDCAKDESLNPVYTFRLVLLQGG